MSTTKNFDIIKRELDGSRSYEYGPYTLFSAFQPLIEPCAEGMTVAGYHGQIRIERQGDSYAPSEFFNAIDQQDIAAMDNQMAVLHLCNAQLYASEDATIHVARSARLFYSPQEMKADADRMRAYALNAGIHPNRVVCELRLRENDDVQQASQFAAHMRRAGFLIGLDGYAGEERDLERVRLFRPSFVRFDPAWTAEFLRNSAGIALLGVIIRQLRDQNTLPIFTCIEEDEMVDTLEHIGAPRLQGHALARPVRAPVDFSGRFRTRPAQGLQGRLQSGDGSAITFAEKPKPVAQPVAELPLRKMMPRRTAPSFGKRGLA